jgi:FtsP/CotA-like multicopper oxidase with cupredoxin domain
MNLDPAESVARRTMELERKDGLWTVNGRVWDDVVASGFTLTEAKPRRDSVETWDLVNKSGGWQHPLHIHLIDFRILSRNGRPPFAFERGPKDVAYLGEGETVRVLTRFVGTGRYMMHCHNLVHEDHDMMVQFEVVDPNNPGIDPLSFPAKQAAGEANDPL